MEELSAVNHFGAEQQSTDRIVSHMLMSFVERKISPQTIADVLRAQIFESQIPISLLNSKTCNGILEAVTLANSVDDCVDLVLYLSTHPSFPENLSFKAAVGSLCVLLRYIQRKAENYKKLRELNQQSLNYEDFLQQDFFTFHPSQALPTEIMLENTSEIPSDFYLKNVKKVDVLIEELSFCILNIFQSNAHLVEFDVKQSLINFIKSPHPVFTKLLRNCERFQHLRFTLMTKNESAFSSEIKGILPKPYEMISLLQKTSDEQILRNGVNHYKTEQAEKNSSSRLKYLQSVIDSLHASSASDIRKTFFTEWIFDNALAEATVNESTVFEFTSQLKYLLENFITNSAIMRGLLKALQKDFSLHSMQDQYIYKANKLTAPIFLYFVTLAEKDLPYITKYIANWALELPLQNEEHRFFKKQHWRWIRTLSAKIWDASLREPPPWVVDAGSLFCALIFQIAPALWLQEYSVSLIERVYQETLTERFTPTAEHFNYVEYLIRCIRKKSPFFASRTESLYALQILSRMTQTELQHVANAKIRFQNLLPNYSPAQIQISPEFLLWKQVLENEESFKQKLGNNPVTRALAVLVKLSGETALGKK